VRARYVSLVVLGFVVGAAVVVLSDPGPDRGSSAAATSAVASSSSVAAGGHVHTTTGVLTGDTPCEQSGPPASPGQTADAEGGHGHRGPAAQLPITEAERNQLAQQQAQARGVAAQFPTVASAEAAGYRKSTTYLPCIGAHYTNVHYVGAFDPSHPSELLFDGTAPDSKIVGLSYLVFNRGGAPEGFAGPNDYWHTHSSNGGLCIKGVVIGPESMSKEQCESLGGHKAGLQDVYMVHDWVVPGWECSWGTFAGECPELGGKVGQSAFS
jgi:hypothetical protein